MARICKVCNHNNRLQVDRALIQGTPKTEIVKMYDLPYHSVDYHEKNHLSYQLETAHRLKEEEQALDLYQELDDLISRTKKILDQSEKDEKPGMSLNAIRELRSNYELLARMIATERAVPPGEEQKQTLTQDEISELLEPLSDRELELFTLLQGKMSGELKPSFDIFQNLPPDEDDSGFDVSGGSNSDDSDPDEPDPEPEPRPRPDNNRLNSHRKRKTIKPNTSEQIPGNRRSRRRNIHGLKPRQKDL